MDQVTFQQVETLFETAVGFDPATRRLFLDRIAREHSREICDLLESLLVCDESQTRWTDIGASIMRPMQTPDPEPPGALIGRFQLVERLGVGGHGEVYLADQQEPVKRRVALKMLRLGAASSEVIARFRAEEQALALMSHPGIAAVYEAGLADQGRLYFAMEHVQGQPIDVYCDQRRLNVPQRLSLVLDACLAVQHAHQKGLIHRDLKPSNILVTERDGRAMPVLIDFGIAVATASVEPVGQPFGSGAGPAMGTPAYMSPEQAGPAPRDIDTRSDIYALGIMLYELLTGRTPLDVLAAPGSSLGEIRRCVVECSPPSPASLLAQRDTQRDDATASVAANRQCTARQLHRRVRGDLDSIVRKAIARQRTDRYQTVEALAHDIHNHLTHRPVTVGSTSGLARARKFVRRHRLIVGMTLAIVAILTVGMTTTTLAMLRAERSAQRSLAINSFLRDLLTSSRPLEKGSTVSFVEVLEGGSAMAADRFSAHPQQEGEIRYLIGHTYYTLALYRDARVELERSLALLRQSLGMDSDATLQAATLLATMLVTQHRLDAAQALADEIVQHSANKPMPMRERFLAAQTILSDILRERGDYESAEANLRLLIPQIDAELGSDHLQAYNARMSLVHALRRQTVAHRDEGHTTTPYEEEVALLREIVQLQRVRFGTEDALPLLIAQIKLGQVLTEQRRFAEAQDIVQPLLATVRDRFGTTHWTYGAAAVSLAEVKYARGDYSGAASDYLEGVQCWRSLYPIEHPNVLSAMRDSLPYLDAAGRFDDGLQEARLLHDKLTTVLGPDAVITLEARAWMARFCSLSGLLNEADEHFAAVERHHDALQGEAAGAYFMLFHAGHLARQGRFEDAEAELLRLCEGEEGVMTGINEHHPDDIARMFIEVYQAWGRPDKVREYQAVVASIWGETR